METWAMLYEIGKIRQKDTKQALVIAIKSEWEFQKDREKTLALRNAELEKLRNGVNDVLKENAAKVPQIEK